jgi:hypothetical protein
MLWGATYSNPPESPFSKVFMARSLSVQHLGCQIQDAQSVDTTKLNAKGPPDNPMARFFQWNLAP